VDQLLYDVTSGVVEEHDPQTGQTVSTVSLGLKSLYQPPVGTIQHNNNNTENLALPLPYAQNNQGILHLHSGKILLVWIIAFSSFQGGT
jgi:hypothetical protein